MVALLVAAVLAGAAVGAVVGAVAETPAGAAAGAARLGRGGRRRAPARVRCPGLLAAGIVLQAAVLAGLLPFAPGAAPLLVAYALLGWFAAANLGRSGMGVVLAGLLLNAVPIALNGGMPVEPGAVVRAGIATPGQVSHLTYGPKRHLATHGDRFRVLDDRVPDWVAHQVLSYGDLVILVGVAAAVAGLVRDRPRRRARGPAVSLPAG